MTDTHHQYDHNGLEINNRSLINRIIALLIEHGDTIATIQLERIKRIIDDRDIVTPELPVSQTEKEEPIPDE